MRNIKTTLLKKLGLKKLDNRIEYISENLAPNTEGKKFDNIAILFGATGFTAEQSYGKETIKLFEDNNIPVICIPGPAAILKKSNPTLTGPIRLHGYSRFSLINWLRAYYAGIGKGGTEKNVEACEQLLEKLKTKGILKGNAEVLMEGWSRGGTAVLQTTWALHKNDDLKGLNINLRLSDPVMGGLHDNKLHGSTENTTLPPNVTQARIIYTFSKLPLFEPHYIEETRPESGNQKPRRRITKIFLPTTHDGMAKPFLRKSTKDIVELNKLYRKLDFGLYKQEEKETLDKNIETLETKIKDRVIELINKDGEKFAKIKTMEEVYNEMNKYNPIKKLLNKKIDRHLLRLANIGRVQLYIDAIDQLDPDKKDQTLQDIKNNAVVIKNLSTERKIADKQKQLSRAFLSGYIKDGSPELTKVVGGSLIYKIRNYFQQLIRKSRKDHQEI